MQFEEILIGGSWRPASASNGFTPRNPATGEPLNREFPVSSWRDCELALSEATQAARILRTASGEQISEFLSAYAQEIESHGDEIAGLANIETGLPLSPRLIQIELPRTITQLRQAAAAAREGSWVQAVLDTKNNIRSYFAPVGPVVVFGPNNFPLAFNSISGGDFAAAVAAGNPVIAKAHPLHPSTSRALAECALTALRNSSLPQATVQMLYHLSDEDGLRLVSDPRVGAISFTGSRHAGMALKMAAESSGRTIYLEMSSLNPIVFLPGALAERGSKLVSETADSCLAASGQFCTSPNLLMMIDNKEAQIFTAGLVQSFAARESITLLSQAGLRELEQSVQQLVDAGAELLIGGCVEVEKHGYHYRNTVLQVSAKQFVTSGSDLQREAFGNATTIVSARNLSDLCEALESLEGNLTGSIYSSTQGEDDALYDAVAPILRPRVGRLLNDKMPTGVALSPAMNHGGPFPATSHPGFTAVGIPRSMLRFGALQCYDNVRPHRLPRCLRDEAPNPHIWRQVDGGWVMG